VAARSLGPGGEDLYSQLPVGRALPPPVDDVQIDPAEALLQSAADVGRAGVPGLRRRFEVGGRRRMTLGRGRHNHRALGATHGGIPALGTLGALEEGKQVVEAPPLSAVRRLGVITCPVPAGENHFVDAGGTTQATAPRPFDLLPQPGLHYLGVCPVRRASAQTHSEPRDGRLRKRLSGASFQQQDTDVRILLCSRRTRRPQ
jgi:hypothetical protein